MKKIALHVDEFNKLFLVEYKDIEESKKNFFLQGIECYEYLRKLSKNKIVDIYENPNGKDAVLEYDKYIIELNDYLIMLKKRGLHPILDSIRKYQEKLELSKHKHKKVTRKNKYSKRRVIASGLCTLILSGCIAGLIYKLSKSETKENTSSVVDILEEDFTSSMDIVISNSTVIVDIESEENVISENYITNDNIIPVLSIDYNDRSNTEKAYMTKAYYWDLINKYSTIYGLDPNLVIAIATQEKGIHSTVKDPGGATGLMQIQNSVWSGQKLSAYNFNTQQKETIIVDEVSLSDVDYNIKIGCMILQTVFKYMKYNTLAAIQCYNMGNGNMKKILNAYSCDCGKSVEEILNNPTDVEWMNYRCIIKEGDQKYIENVFSWLGSDIELNNKKDDGTEVCFNINNLEQVKTRY